MTTWNYRIVSKRGEGVDSEYTYYGIHEVYYDEDHNPVAVTEDAIVYVTSIHDSDNISEEEIYEIIKGDLENMLLALDKPICKFEDFVV